MKCTSFTTLLLNAVVALTVSSLPAISKDLSRVMIDMSSHNSQIEVDSKLRKNEAIELIFHRVTIGRYLKESDADKLFEKRAREAHFAGIRFGAYHLAFPSSDAIMQAKHFLKATRERCIDGQQLLLAVDWEWATSLSLKKKVTVNADFIAEFVEQVSTETGKPVIIYTNAERISTLRNAPKAVQDTLINQPLWFAQYFRKFTYASEGENAPIRDGIVFPQEEFFAPWDGWTFWQFGEGKGRNPTRNSSVLIGNEKVDVNYFDGQRTAFSDFFEKNAWECKRIARE